MNFLSHTCKHRINNTTCVVLESKCIKRRFFKSDSCALQVPLDPPKMPKCKSPKPEGPQNSVEAGCPR